MSFFINDLPDVVSSTAKIFGDDTKLFHEIRTIEDRDVLLQDLDNQMENNMARHRWCTSGSSNHAGCLQSSVRHRDILCFKTLLTYPVSVCTTERSFSALKRIKTPLRNAMTGHRLSFIVLLVARQYIPPSPSHFWSLLITVSSSGMLVSGMSCLDGGSYTWLR